MLKNLMPVAAAAALAVTAALPAKAADIPYDPPVYYEPAPPKETFSGWYLRGHIGMSNQRFRGLASPDLSVVIEDPAAGFEWLDRGRFGAAPIFGVGLGYQFNDWIRADVTAEYRHTSRFSALDSWVGAGGPVVNHYTARKSELLFLANAYADLGTFSGFTPYVGAGIGTSRNTISRFRDHSPNVPETATAASHSQWQLAWALHAGVGVDVTPRTTLDFGYSFVHLGNGRTGEVNVPNPAFPLTPFEFRRLQSHDFKIALRYKFN